MNNAKKYEHTERKEWEEKITGQSIKDKNAQRISCPVRYFSINYVLDIVRYHFVNKVLSRCQKKKRYETNEWDECCNVEGVLYHNSIFMEDKYIFGSFE